MLSAQARKKIEALKSEYETNLSALIPALHVAQGEQGWLSEEIQAEVATLLELTPQAVREVVHARIRRVPRLLRHGAGPHGERPLP